MKHSFRIISQYLPWLLLLLGIDAFAALLLWLAEAQAFFSMTAVILLATVLLFSVLCVLLVRGSQKREAAFLAFLSNPDEYHEEALLKTICQAQREYVHLLGMDLRDKQNSYARLLGQVNDYEEYVEAWAHETKTPLSLLTLLLDNRREEMPPAIGCRLDHIQIHLQEAVDQMLFYARLKSARKDYLFESILLRTCVEEVLEDYKPLLEEKHFRVQCTLPDHKVYSDRRGLRFLLGQIISNSIKYCGEEPALHIELFRRDNVYVLRLQDNGMGMHSCDLPYLFEKGFTGDSGENRKKATGMGLYLAKEIAEEMKLSLEAASEWGKGFEMKVLFPVVEKLL